MNNKRMKAIIPLGISLLLLSLSCSSSIVDLFRLIDRVKAGLSEKSIQVNNHTIAYLEGGKGESVLLIHGFGDNKNSWAQFSKFLTDKFHVIVPDLPGFGESTKILSESYDMETQVKRLHDFVTMKGLKKFHIAGNSMGGLIAGMYSVTYPDEILSLGLLDTGGVINREPSRFSIELKKGINPLVVETASDFDRMLNFIFFKPPDIPGPMKTYLAEMAVKSSSFNKKVFKEMILGNQLEKRMNEIHAKTLIIWGDSDWIFPVSSARVLENGIKNSRVIIMKNCGHVPMTERPEESAKYYLDFISTVKR
jgi:abhydrolase domain-containing protein 6